MTEKELSKPHQRIGAKSNSQVGREFELATQLYFETLDLLLERNVKIAVGVEIELKEHAFDLGCLERKIIIECKSHKWTAGGNVPSAKLTVWNEAMYYFHAAPAGYRKIMFVLRDYSEKRKMTLASYYLNRYSHLVPSDVELWEYCENDKQAVRVN